MEALYGSPSRKKSNWVIRTDLPSATFAFQNVSHLCFSESRLVKEEGPGFNS